MHRSDGAADASATGVAVAAVDGTAVVDAGGEPALQLVCHGGAALDVLATSSFGGRGTFWSPRPDERSVGVGVEVLSLATLAAAGNAAVGIMGWRCPTAG